MPKISVIVPCYNEEEVLPIFYKEICRISSELSELEWEYIFIDDGSKDKTLSIILEFCQENDNLKFISFSRNFGKEAAMFAGFEASTGDYVVVMDADMQDPPALIPEMYSYVCNGEYDSVATRRVNRKGEPPIRSFFARRFYKLINRISKTDIVDGARDFRLMNRQMTNAILEMGEYNRFSKGIYGWVGFKTKWLPYKNIERVAGKTKWSFRKLFFYSLDGITAFSTAPLLISSIAGFFMFIASIISIIVIIIRTIAFGDPVAGWPSLVSIVLFIGGIQLLCIGILGQYLSKTYLEVKRRPQYLVKDSNIHIAKVEKDDI